MTVGSKSTKTALGTCLPAPVSLKKVLKESSPPPMVLSLGIWPSGWMPCSRQYNSQHALPIWTPAWPTCIEIHSRCGEMRQRPVICFFIEANIAVRIRTVGVMRLHFLLCIQPTDSDLCLQSTGWPSRASLLLIIWPGLIIFKYLQTTVRVMIANQSLLHRLVCIVLSAQGPKYHRKADRTR